MFPAGDAAKCQNAASPRPRMYTVLPPPPDYNIHLDESVALPQLKSINSDKDPAGKTAIKFLFYRLELCTIKLAEIYNPHTGSLFLHVGSPKC